MNSLSVATGGALPCLTSQSLAVKGMIGSCNDGAGGRKRRGKEYTEANRRYWEALKDRKRVLEAIQGVGQERIENSGEVYLVPTLSKPYYAPTVDDKAEAKANIQHHAMLQKLYLEEQAKLEEELAIFLMMVE